MPFEVALILRVRPEMYVLKPICTILVVSIMVEDENEDMSEAVLVQHYVDVTLSPRR
jgi:hypothetical protein